FPRETLKWRIREKTSRDHTPARTERFFSGEESRKTRRKAQAPRTQEFADLPVQRGIWLYSAAHPLYPALRRYRPVHVCDLRLWRDRRALYCFAEQTLYQYRP